MNKADLKVLELAFEREIHGAILQGKSKRIDRLVEEGYLQPETVTFGGRFAVVCKGYALTHAGRITYRTTCDDDQEKA